MPRVTGIVANSGEDFVDELASSITYKYSNQIFSPTVKKLNESDSLVDNALGGAVSTLQFGIMNYVIMSVTEYAISKATFAAGAIFLFLKTTNVARKTKGIIAGALGSIPFVGRGMGNVVRATGSFVAKDRELIAKMAMDTSNNMSTVISQERQNQISMKKAKYDKIDNTISNAISLRGDSRQHRMGYFVLKTKQGTWSKTNWNKKLYEDCTGQNLKEMGISWNNDFVDKLNSFSEFATTSEGQVFNQAKATIDMMSLAGKSVMK